MLLAGALPCLASIAYAFLPIHSCLTPSSCPAAPQFERERSRTLNKELVAARERWRATEAERAAAEDARRVAEAAAKARVELERQKEEQRRYQEVGGRAFTLRAARVLAGCGGRRRRRWLPAAPVSAEAGMRLLAARLPLLAACDGVPLTDPKRLFAAAAAAQAAAREAERLRAEREAKRKEYEDAQVGRRWGGAVWRLWGTREHAVLQLGTLHWQSTVLLTSWLPSPPRRPRWMPRSGRARSRSAP